MAYLQQSVAATQRESNRCTGQEICEITALKGLDHKIELIILTKKNNISGVRCQITFRLSFFSYLTIVQ
jgi:hypothetical protein